MFTYSCVAGFVFYKGYMAIGPSMFLLGWPLAMAAGFFAVSVVLALFPPKVEPYAQHRTWLKLN